MTFRDDRILCASCGGALVPTGTRHTCEGCGATLAHLRSRERAQHRAKV
ncbi:MAG: hypothetical protein H0T42_15335 [Deltaproteobacteria bacterium]|nr:hypothetical protein [Deltaproteobacteria bacterium]